MLLRFFLLMIYRFSMSWRMLPISRVQTATTRKPSPTRVWLRWFTPTTGGRQSWVTRPWTSSQARMLCLCTISQATQSSTSTTRKSMLFLSVHYRKSAKCCTWFINIRDVLFEYHRAVVPFYWAVRPVRSLLTGIPILVVFQNIRWNSNKTSVCKGCPYLNNGTTN